MAVRPGLRMLAVTTGLVLLILSGSCNASPQAKEAKYLRRGAALLQKKDYPRALLEFKNAISAMPGAAEPHYQTGMAYLGSGDFPSAVAAFRKATELNPEHQQAQLKVAQLMTTSENREILQQAENRLDIVLAVRPDNSEANEALALVEWKLGKTEEASKRLENTLLKFPTRLQSSIELARLKLRQKDLPSAEKILQQAVVSAPQSAAAELALGQFYMLANQPSKAEAELQKAVRLDPKNGPALMGVAAIQVAGHRLEDAELTYRQLASLPNSEFKPLHALFLYRIGKRDAAVAELEKLTRENPADRSARSRLFYAYSAMGKSQAAQKIVDAAIKKNPKDIEALYERAGLFLQAGNTIEAEKDVNEILRSQADFAPGHLAMAAIHKAQHLQRSERQELNEALRINPALLQARLTLARNLIKANDAKSALELLNGTPANQSTLLGVVVERNWAFLASGDLKEVRSVLDRIHQDQRIPEVMVQDAYLRLQQGDYAGARAAAEEVIKNSPADLRGPRLLAESYVAQKQPAKAEERLRAIAAEHPQSAPLASLLGQWYLGTKDLTGARKAFEAATVADPAFTPAILALAQIDYREKYPEAALQRLRLLVARSPNDTSALLLWATIAADIGDQTEAINRYRAVLAIDDSNLMALNNLAYTLAISDPDEALKYAQMASQLSPDSAYVQDTLGWIYYRKAIYGMATTYLETAVAREPTPRRQFHLAMSYLKLGKRDLGRKTLLLALQQDPSLQQTEKGW